jgi:hypothetical protein
MCQNKADHVVCFSRVNAMHGAVERQLSPGEGFMFVSLDELRDLLDRITVSSGGNEAIDDLLLEVGDDAVDDMMVSVALMGRTDESIDFVNEMLNEQGENIDDWWKEHCLRELHNLVISHLPCFREVL